MRYNLCHVLSTMGNCMYLRMTFSRIQLRETQLLNTVAMYYRALRPVGSCMLFRRTVSYIFSARSISEWISSCSLYCSAPTYQPPPPPVRSVEDTVKSERMVDISSCSSILCRLSSAYQGSPPQSIAQPNIFA